MACPERFELPTLALEVPCSIQLSYGQIVGGGLTSFECPMPPYGS